MSKEGQDKIYAMVTDKIVAELKRGVIPWKKPWKSSGVDFPTNLRTGKEYRGTNVIMLLCAGSFYDSQYWLTFKQAKELGGTVKSGEKGFPVVFWKFITSEENDNEFDTPRSAFLRYYTVFNIAQCEGISLKQESLGEPKLPITEAEAIVKGYKSPPMILVSYSHAFYRPPTDDIYIPDVSAFSSIEEYYSTLFHEMIHSTGNSLRLNRDLSAMRGKDKESYSTEELIAEIGSAFLCAKAGISNEVIQNQTAYISGWLSALKNDNKMLLRAASKAQGAADYILGKEKENA